MNLALFEDDGTPRTKAVTKDDREHSQWYDRNTMWLILKSEIDFSNLIFKILLNLIRDHIV